MTYTSIEELIEDLQNNPIELGGNIYHPIPFPEFDHLKTSSQKIEVFKKWHLIEKEIDNLFSQNSKLNVLDVGANAGFYTFSLAKKGANVTAFELHPRYNKLANFVIDYKNLDIQWFDTPLNTELIKDKNFDIALMLSVFQWMSQGGSHLEKAIQQLRRISEISTYLIFELGFNKGKSCIKTKKINHYAELINFLNEHTSYQFFKLLGTTKIWKTSFRYLVICSNNSKLDDPFLLKLVRKLRI